MKAKAIVVFVENIKGDFWQISLGKEERSMVMDLITQMHGDKIKILDNKLPLKYDKILKP